MMPSIQHIPPDDLCAHLVLHAIPGLGPATFAALVHHFKTPAEALSAPISRLYAVPGIGQTLAQAIRHAQDWDQARDQIHRAETLGIAILSLSDPRYPPLLRQIHAPPPVLYSCGNLDLLHCPAIGIVGSRSFTLYGRDTTCKLAADLARSGIAVVSGMAMGIDTHAHRGALDARGPTIAVLGSSLDCPYPPENRDLFRDLCTHGLACSEFPLGTGPEPHNFPRRNRIISGLSLGTVVVEAGARSGALITAQFALEQNRDVFAVPGPIHSGKSAGTNRLIREGAILVTCADDILQEIAPHLRSVLTPPAPQPDLSPEEQAVWDALNTSELRHVDAIARNLHMSSAAILEILLDLELRNLIEQAPGMRYRRR